MAVNDYKIIATNTLEGEDMTYVIPIMKTPRSSGELGGTSIALDRPVNNKIFSLSGKRESGTLEFQAFERFNPASVDSPFSDRSYDADKPSGERHTLDYLIQQLEAGTANSNSASVQQATADQLKARFQQDSAGNYVVRSVREQRIWLREYVHNPGLSAEWTLFGPSFDFRTVDGLNNPQGTPIVVEAADIEPSANTDAIGTGRVQFKVGGRL